MRANAWDRWEQLTRRLELWDELIERLLAVGDCTQAARVYLERGQLLQAAQCYDRAGLPVEALAAYQRLKPDVLTGEARRRLAELAEAAGELDTAMRAYEALEEWAQAAALAEAAGQYEPALAFYRQAGQELKTAELLLKMARYAEAAELFAHLYHWGQAAGSLEQQVDHTIERAGGVRNVRKEPHVEAWLEQAAAWFEEGANVAEEAIQIEVYNQGAERCRLKLRQVRGESLLSWSVQAGAVLMIDEGNTLRYVVENVGWGAAEEVSLSIGGSFLHGVETEQLGTLKRRQKKEGPITIVPKIPGQVTLRVELRGRSAGGDWREAVTQTVTVARRGAVPGETLTPVNIQRTVSRPAGEEALWAESGSSTPAADSLAELNRQRLDSLRRRLARHHANLAKLQEQAAQYGTGQAPLYLQNQIESEQNAIAGLEEELTA